MSATLVLLEFDAGRFVQAWSEPRRAPGNISAGGVESILLGNPATFQSRWARMPSPPETRIVLSCSRHDPTSRGALNRADVPPDVAGFTQSLALLPFALGLAGLNAHRLDAMREGRAEYDQLAPATDLSQSARRYVAAHKFMQLIPSLDPDYMVFKIDLGAYPGRNLTNFDDIGLIGIRTNRVVWRTLTYSQASGGIGIDPALALREGRSVYRPSVGVPPTPFHH